jgi:vancomycin permeability regulator SanA
MAARILALFLSLLTLTNLLGNWSGFDASGWWISFPWLPHGWAKAVLLVSAGVLLAFAVRGPSRERGAPVTAGIALFLAIAALLNAAEFYRLLFAGRIAAGFPVPLSLVGGLGLLLIARAAWFPRGPRIRFRFWKIAAAGLCLLAAFPLALMLFFGNTDYRRPADVAVVFGARAYADGRLSDALEDRMRTACELYRAGFTKRLVLSGGPGDGAVTEAEAMRRYAIQQGVPPESILLDTGGVSTEATVRNTVPVLRQLQARRVMVVSHFYHLPRIKLAYQRAGMEVLTVPARQARVLGQIPYNMAREVAAFWVYFLRQKPAASDHAG